MRADRTFGAIGEGPPRADCANVTGRKYRARNSCARNFVRISKKPPDKPGSVTARERAMTVIRLGTPLPACSSRLPADSASSVVVRLFGVAPDGGCRVSPASTREATRLCGPVPHLRRGREAGLMRPGVTRHPALWSPDFPLPRIVGPEAATIWGASISIVGDPPGKPTPHTTCCAFANERDPRQQQRMDAKRGAATYGAMLEARRAG